MGSISEKSVIFAVEVKIFMKYVICFFMGSLEMKKTKIINFQKIDISPIFDQSKRCTSSPALSFFSLLNQIPEK